MALFEATTKGLFKVATVGTVRVFLGLIYNLYIVPPRQSRDGTYDQSLRCSLTAKTRSDLNMNILKSHRRRVLRPFRFLANGRSFFGSATVPLVAAGTTAAALLMGIASLAVLKRKSHPRKLKKARSRVESKKVFRGPGVRFAHRAAA